MCLEYIERENDSVLSGVFFIVLNYTQITLMIYCIDLFLNELYGSYNI